MMTERLQLVGAERARYFAPTLICVYLAAICLTLVVISVFLKSMENAAAVTGAGLFGLLLTSLLGTVFWRAQQRDLVYVRFTTTAAAAANFVAIKAAAEVAGWRIVRAEPGHWLDAETSSTLRQAGERVAVRFRGSDVWVASICDPGVGYSMVGRRHCDEHRALLQRAVAGSVLRETRNP